MATLKSIPFHHKNEAGESFGFTGECTVSNDGVFSITIHDDMAETAQAMAKVAEKRVRVVKPRTIWRVEAATLEIATNFVRDALKSHLTVEVIRERVICYEHKASVACYVNPNGSMTPNGHFGDYPHGRFYGKLDGSTKQAPAYHVAFVAKVFDRVTYRRASHERIVFEAPEHEGSHFDKTPMHLLNGFVGVGLFNPTKDTPAMPYTDEAAEFFADMMLGMCNLAMRLDEFLGDGQRLALAIEKRVPLLAAPAANDDKPAKAKGAR